METSASSSTHVCQTLLLKRLIRSRWVDANDPIIVSGVDIQVAFYAIGLPEHFQDMFALDPIEAWEMCFAGVVAQGIVDSWSEVVYPVLTLLPVGWNQALNVCQWVHEHIAERVSGISAENRFTDFVAVSFGTHGIGGQSRGLSQQESMARDAAERVYDALVKAGLPVHPVTCSPREFRLGVRSVEAVVWVSRRGLWRFRVALLHVASLGWARTKSVLWLVTSRFELKCGESSWLLSARLTPSQRGSRQRRRLWAPVICELRVAASLIFLAHRDLSAPWCSDTCCGSERNGPLQRSLAILADRNLTQPPVQWSKEHLSDQLHDPYISCRRHSHRHQSHCHPYLTYTARSGEHR